MQISQGNPPKKKKEKNNHNDLLSMSVEYLAYFWLAKKIYSNLSVSHACSLYSRRGSKILSCVVQCKTQRYWFRLNSSVNWKNTFFRKREGKHKSKKFSQGGILHFYAKITKWNKTVTNFMAFSTTRKWISCLTTTAVHGRANGV